MFLSPARHRALVAGRRFGKTYLSSAELVRAVWGKPKKKAWYVAPTYRQAQEIAWEDLVTTYADFIEHRDNGDLSLRIRGGGRISLRGAKDYDRLRGPGIDFLVCDEYASMDPRAWEEVLRAMLADRLGRALFIGTPKGRNHFWKLYNKAQGDPEWSSFTFTTLDGGRVPASEVEASKRDLDPKTFRQEYLATFETYSGLVYYTFNRDIHVVDTEYNPQEPIRWMLDFNVDPHISLIGQIETPMRLAADQRRYVRIIDEIALRPGDTPTACEEFARRARKWFTGRKVLQVYVYGDATGRNRSTVSGGNDWDVVRNYFAGKREFELIFKIPDSNPSVKQRINLVNSMLQSYDGTVRMTIHPRCAELLADMEEVVWEKDSQDRTTGDVDKHCDAKRTHASDALGYMIFEEFNDSVGPAWQSSYLA